MKHANQNSVSFIAVNDPKWEFLKTATALQFTVNQQKRSLDSKLTSRQVVFFTSNHAKHFLKRTNSATTMALMKPLTVMSSHTKHRWRLVSTSSHKKPSETGLETKMDVSCLCHFVSTDRILQVPILAHTHHQVVLFVMVEYESVAALLPVTDE